MIDTYDHYWKWMTILSQPIENNNTIYYSPRVGTGFSNNFRAIRGLMLLCLYQNRGLRSKLYYYCNN